MRRTLGGSRPDAISLMVANSIGPETMHAELTDRSALYALYGTASRAYREDPTVPDRGDNDA